jgi:hypothetical protein
MPVRIELGLSPEDLKLILLALGQLPYAQVHELIGRIEREAGPQLVAAARARAEPPDSLGEAPP